MPMSSFITVKLFDVTREKADLLAAHTRRKLAETFDVAIDTMLAQENISLPAQLARRDRERRERNARRGNAA